MTVHGLERSVREEVTDANSVLLLAPSFSDDEGETCGDLLVPEEAHEQNALWVSYTRSPDRQVRRFRSQSASAPRNVGIISVDDVARSASSMNGPDTGAGTLVETVTSPNDLTGLGIRITEYLKRWQNNGSRTVVCFDSLTAMLQYVELETAYEFLHVLTGRFAAIGAFAHFHMDPTAHDEQTVETIVSLFDAVVELDEQGHTVRTR